MASGRKTGGRLRGTPNKTTSEVKAALSEAFDDLGGVPSLVTWGRTQPTEFYKLWTKLLPTELKADVSIGLEDLIDALSPPDAEAAEG